MKLTKNQQEQVNRFMRELNIDFSSSKAMNCIRIHPAESLRHFTEKCRLCWTINQANRPFYTESLTVNQRRRYDILDPLNPDGDYIIEIETNNKIEKKDVNKTIKI